MLGRILESPEVQKYHINRDNVKEKEVDNKEKEDDVKEKEVDINEKEVDNKDGGHVIRGFGIVGRDFGDP